MTMIDLYLKAGSKSAMTQALKTAGFSQDPDSGALYHPDAALDVIGTIYQPTGETMMEGELVPVMAPVPGYHANVRTRSAALATALDAQRVYPKTPTQKWA
ncbi:hypothetical protein [Aeromonas salmonicida]|uniref:hypothetical protein n=1 Tax=Aeromonas salmonicida TaxID=645 RepID=UPI00240DA404|nr:hypothetical protein [Aeromonas salmonicida]WFC15434.1 hypothetical protein L3V47_06700 [Aeromonas salmonicida]